LPRPLRERFLKHLGDLLRPLLDVTDVAVELALGAEAGRARALWHAGAKLFRRLVF
jgi:hypothetical protein